MLSPATFCHFKKLFVIFYCVLSTIHIIHKSMEQKKKVIFVKSMIKKEKNLKRKKMFSDISLASFSNISKLLLLSNVVCHNCVDSGWCDNNAWLSICRTILLFNAATDDLSVWVSTSLGFYIDTIKLF